MLNKNLIVNGEFKSGKTSGIIMPIVDGLIKSDKSLLFIDKKFEYYGNCASKLKKEGYEIKVLNFDVPMYSDSVNVLEVPYKYYKDGDKDKAYEIVSMIVSAIFPKDVNNDPFWTDSAISLVRGYILKLFELAKEDEINFLSVSRFLDTLDTESIKEIREFLLKDDNDAAKRDLISVLSAPYETRASIISVTRIQINKLVNYENKLNVISNEEFKLSDFLVTNDNKKHALFLVPKMEDSNNELVNMILAEAYQLCKNQNWYFILDNFDMLGKMNNFKGMFLSSSYRNIYMVIGTRDVDSLVNEYGKEIFQVCDVKNSKDLNVSNIDKMNTNFQMMSADLKEILPNLKKKEIKTFDILDAMSK